MRKFLVGAVSAAGIFALSGTAAMAAMGFECTVDGSGAYTLSATAGGSDHVVLTNEAGAKISVAASVGNPAESGSLFFSPGSTVLTFPSGTSAQITDAVSGVGLMLLANDGPVTVTLTCNPDSSPSAVTPEPVPSAAVDLVRDRTIGGLIDDIRHMPRSSDETLYLVRMLQAKQYGWDGVQAIYDFYMSDMLNERDAYRNDLSSPDRERKVAAARALGELEDQMNALEKAYGTMAILRPGVTPNAYAARGTESGAVAAINSAAGISDPVTGTFNLLGYGPMTGFEGSALLAEGDNWRVAASGVGAISQTERAAGNIYSVSGRGTINIVTALTPRIGAGLALSLGATSETGGSIEDRANHFAADFALDYRIARNLHATGRLGYELTNHNYTRGTASGNVSSHLYTAGLEVSGDYDLPEFTLSPSLGVDFTHESQAAVTLSDNSIVNGFDRTGAKATIGGQISHTYVVTGQDSAMLVTPKLGIDGSVSLFHTRTSAGTDTSSTVLGVALTAGVDLQLQSGLGLGLSTRISRSGDTTGGSVTGKISASF